MAHTPGPWRGHFYVGNQRLRTGHWGLIGGDGFPLFCAGVKANCGNSEADIRLAATAPELLAVCQAIANDLSLFQFTDGEYRLSEQSAGVILQSLREVIAKAEGRSE